MKKLLLITILYCPFLASAQKLLKPAIDKVSGDTAWSTSKEKLYVHLNFLTQQGEGLECYVTKKGKSITLILMPQTMNEQSVFTITDGQKAYLKFKDNSSVTLQADQFVMSDAKVGEALSTVYSNGIIKAPYTLTNDNIAKIKASDVVFIRIETSEGNFDCDIKSKFSQVIKKELELVTN